MTVTLKNLQLTIQAIYNSKPPHALPEEQGLIFGANCNQYIALICVRLFERDRHGQNSQAIGMSFGFTVKDNIPLDLQKHPLADIHEVCSEIQQELDWSTLSPIKLPSGAVEVTLYRAFGTSKTDLAEAVAGNTESQFHTALCEMTVEFAMATTILRAFAAEQIKDFAYIRQMMNVENHVQA